MGSSERAIMDTEDRIAGQEPLFALPFSRIHPSINSGHIVRRHTSKGLRGAKSKNVATRFSCTETWAVRRLAQMFGLWVASRFWIVESCLGISRLLADSPAVQ